MRVHRIVSALSVVVALNAIAADTSGLKFKPRADALPSNATTFIAVAPCRLVDTRNANGPFGGPKFGVNETRTYTVPQGACGLPIAAAYSVNFTITAYVGDGFLTAWPAGIGRPVVSTLNFGTGAVVANAAVVPADATGAFNVFVVNPTHVIIDVNGYFTESGGTSANVANKLVLRDSTGSFAAGTISATKVLNAVYQDVAEWVPSASTLAPGTVVVLDPADGRRVTASSCAYDTAVAGVVSENPGIVLGRAAEDKAQIATTGRVRVRVDATRAPIGVGDLLVTSDLPGTAMRSQPMSVDGVALHRPGTIIGKALEPLASGKGEILVLLSLQ